MRFGHFLMGLALIMAGVISLLVNLGYGSWDMVVQLSRFWPILLIILGISCLTGRQIPRWLALILVVACVAAVVALFLYAPADAYKTIITI